MRSVKAQRTWLGFWCVLALGLGGLARASPESSRPESRRAGDPTKKAILDNRSPSVCRPEEHSSSECARSPRFFWTAVARSYAAQKAPIAQKRVSRPEDSRSNYYLEVAQKPVLSSPECDPEDSSKCSAPIRKGEPAPYDGQVLTTELAIDLGQRAMHCEERISIENARLEALRKVDADREKAIHNAIQKIHEQQLLLLEKQLDQALSRPFWTDPVFVSSVTAVVTLGSALGIWWLAVQTVQAANSK